MKSKYDLSYIIVFFLTMVCAIGSIIINIMVIGGADIIGLMKVFICIVLGLKIIISLADLIAAAKYGKQNPVNTKVRIIDGVIYIVWGISWLITALT